MNQQASIEELKECREAFEQWMQETYGYVPEPNTVYRNGTYLSKRDDDRWIAYQAAWNRRTSPCPAEVSSEGLPKLPEPEAGLGLSTAILHAGPVFTVKQMHAYARQALSQQSKKD